MLHTSISQLVEPKSKWKTMQNTLFCLFIGTYAPPSLFIFFIYLSLTLKTLILWYINMLHNSITSLLRHYNHAPKSHNFAYKYNSVPHNMNLGSKNILKLFPGLGLRSKNRAKPSWAGAGAWQNLRQLYNMYTYIALGRKLVCNFSDDLFMFSVVVTAQLNLNSSWEWQSY